MIDEPDQPEKPATIDPADLPPWPDVEPPFVPPPPEQPAGNGSR